MSSAHLILFAANLVLITTHVYGWLLKWFYKPLAYSDRFQELFPAQRAMGVIYLLQLFELPYLLQIADADALLYVNAFVLMCFSCQTLVMWEGYFFPHASHSFKEYVWMLLPAILVVLPLLVQAVCHFDVSSVFGGHYLLVVFAVVTLAFAFYFYHSVRMAMKIRGVMREANENRFADDADFPVDFARIILWVHIFVLVILLVNFYANNPWAKFVRDIIFIIANVWFCLDTLNPWRKGLTPAEAEPYIFGTSSEPMPVEEQVEEEAPTQLEDRYKGLILRLNHLLNDEHIYTEPHLVSDTLLQRLGTNSTYLSEVIRRCGYQSYYDMISQLRVRHAISLIQQDPTMRLSDVAQKCGFSSQASMNKAFKAQGKPAPSKFKVKE